MWQQDRFRTITLVLYIGSLPNLATWFPCGRGRTLFILRSLPLYRLIIYIDGRILWCTHFLFLGAIILMWYTRNIFLLASDIFVINWTVRMSDNLPERVQILGHAHIICIIVRENRIICCQIFCDLLLESAFERICNVMQLILVKIKWHIKGKYLIKNSTIFAFHITLNNENWVHNKQYLFLFCCWKCSSCIENLTLSYNIYCFSNFSLF